MSVIPRTLRFRVVVLLLVAFLLCAGVFILTMNIVVETNYRQLDSESVVHDLTRVQTAVEQQVGEIDGIAGALAVRGTTASDTFPASAMASLGVDFIVITDAQGKVVGTAAAVEAKTISPVAAATLVSAVPEGEAGILGLSGGSAAVASRPLQGGGAVLLGRDLQPRAPAISKLVQAQVNLADPGSRLALSVPAGETGVVALSDDANLGWVEMNGLDGAPALLVTVKAPRPIMRQARATMAYIEWGIALLSVLVGLSIVIMLEGSVLNRLARLRESVTEYPEDEASLQPVAAEGSDEISDLAEALNQTLGRMKASENAHKHDARHDHLTGLANRRQLEEHANRILGECTVDGHTCCTLVLIDLDGFKRINDDLGHQVGDEVLVWFAEHMRESLRADSTLCRLGGDEFGVLLPHTNREEATIAIERLRDATSREEDNPCFGMAQVRFSVGYAVAPDHGETLEMLSQCADTDLYANKRGKAEAAGESADEAAAEEG